MQTQTYRPTLIHWSEIRGVPPALGSGAGLMPPGGADGDVLTKTSGVDYETAWEAPTGGGGSGLTHPQAMSRVSLRF